MAFLNPFVGMTPKRKMTRRELTRSLRLSLATEEEAVHLYEALADATDNRLAKAVLQDIADEERVHVGEFQALLAGLAPNEVKLLAKGIGEVRAQGCKMRRGRRARRLCLLRAKREVA